MENRLEILRNEIDKLIFKKQTEDIRMYISHMYGVGRFCTLLAIKRNMDVELATTCGMLHDICYMTGEGTENHALRGSEIARNILSTLGTYSNEEIDIIAVAISRHSDKRVVNEPYDELLKDADVMDHCFYNFDFPISESEMLRYHNLLIEFGLDI